MPGTSSKDMELDITPNFLDLRTPRFRLGLPLPHPVDDKAGSAKFDLQSSTLRITLPLRREYDFLRT